MAFTYFFRDLHTLNLIVEHLLPFVAGSSSINIWDAGCASGEEPFTMAILLSEKMNPYAFRNVKIYATDLDISNQFGKIIGEGIYPFEKIERIPEVLFKKYFSHMGNNGHFCIDSLLKEKVIFKRENLLDLKPVNTELSLVICKNVLLHQNYQQRIEIVKMFHQALANGGLLAMEHTQKLPKEVAGLFEQVVPNAQLYRCLK